MYKLIVGLGNPGKEYSQTRHNIGFMALDLIAKALHGASFAKKFRSEFANVKLGSKSLILLKPQTFMNNSGIAVRECLSFYKIPPKEVLVIHDELDIQVAKIKIKAGGGNGGHNGLKSIDQHIGKGYYRLRFGIARPEQKHEVADYVLSEFMANELALVNFALYFITANLDLLLSSQYDLFLNNYAIALQKNMEN